MVLRRICWPARYCVGGQEKARLKQRPHLVGEVGGFGADQLLVRGGRLAEDDRPMCTDDRVERREADV